MANEAEIIISNILSSAIEYKRLYDTTKKIEYREKEQRLRRIAENIKLITGPTSTSAVSSFNGRTGAVILNSSDVVSALGYTPGIGDMLKSVYDYDNDGVVDSAERTEIIVRNSTGSTLTKGTVVYLSGATGNRPNALKAKADAEATSSKTFGFVVSDIPNNSDGYVACAGTLHDLDTSAFADGTALWLSPTTAGGWTDTVPSEPNHSVFLGYVARSHPTQGRVVILIQNGYELNELHDVVVSSPTNGQLLRYNGTAGYWENWTHTFLTSVPTLDQVTTAGNTTTNAITVNKLTITGNGESYNMVVGSASDPTNWNQFISTEGTGEFGIYQDSFYFQPLSSLANGIRFFNSANVVALNIFQTANVGINTTTDAGYKLDVNGTARVSGNLTIQTTSDAILTFNSNNAQITWTNGAFGVFYSGTRLLRISNTGEWKFQNKIAVVDTTTVTGVNASLYTQTSLTASAALAQGVYFNNTLVAAANNDVLVGLDINPTFTNGSFTGVANYGVRVQNGDVYLNSVSGNTGIGIAPVTAHKLNVGGNIRISAGVLQIDRNLLPHIAMNASGTNYGLLQNQSATSWSLAYGSGHGSLGTAVLTWFGASGNVGINTTTDAGYKLDVNGTGRFSGNLEINAGANGQIFINNTAPRILLGVSNTPTWSMFADTANAGQFEMGKGAGFPYNTFSRFLYVGTDGKMALGGNTSASGTKLLLSGSVTAQTALGVGTSITQTITAAANNDVLVGLDINPTFTNGAFTGVSNWGLRVQNSDILINGISFGKGFGTQNVYIGPGVGGFSNTGAGLMDQNIFIGQGAGASFQNNSNGHVAIGFNALKGGNNSEYNVAIGMQSLANFTGQYNVAVGKDSGYDNTSGGFNTFIGFSTGRGITTGNSNTVIGSQVGGLSTSLSNTVILSDGAGSIRFYSPSSGNVLIGTTTDAGYKLDVAGTIRAKSASGNIIQIDHNTGSTIFNVAANKDISFNDYGQIYFFKTTNILSTYGIGSDFNIRSGGVIDALWIKSNGNILMGTSTDAGYKLQVVGTTKSDKFLVIDTTNTSVIRIGASTASEGGLYLRSGATSDGEIAGGVYFVNGLAYAAATGASAVNFYAGNTYFTGDSSLTVGSTFVPTTRMFIQNNGNVGIGNTSPTAKLHVSGAIKATLTNGSTANVIYYDTTSGLFTYATAPSGGGGGTLDSVTTAGNSTANSISVGGLTVANGAAPIAVFNSSNGGGSYLGIQYSGALKAAWGMGGNIIGGLSINDVGFWSSNAMAWEAGGARRMTLFSSGNFVINSLTDNGNALQVNGTVDGTGFAHAGVPGWTGTLNIPLNPPGQQNIDIRGGIIINIF